MPILNPDKCYTQQPKRLAITVPTNLPHHWLTDFYALTKVDLSKKTLREIHTAILYSRFANEAATKLGVYYTVFQNFLAQATYLDDNQVSQPLSYKVFNKEWPYVQAGELYWGERYDQPLATNKKNTRRKKTTTIPKNIAEQAEESIVNEPVPHTIDKHLIQPDLGDESNPEHTQFSM